MGPVLLPLQHNQILHSPSARQGRDLEQSTEITATQEPLEKPLRKGQVLGYAPPPFALQKGEGFWPAEHSLGGRELRNGIKPLQWTPAAATCQPSLGGVPELPYTTGPQTFYLAPPLPLSVPPSRPLEPEVQLWERRDTDGVRGIRLGPQLGRAQGWEQSPGRGASSGGQEQSPQCSTSPGVEPWARGWQLGPGAEQGGTPFRPPHGVWPGPRMETMSPALKGLPCETLILPTCMLLMRPDGLQRRSQSMYLPTTFSSPQLTAPKEQRGACLGTHVTAPNPRALPACQPQRQSAWQSGNKAKQPRESLGIQMWLLCWGVNEERVMSGGGEERQGTGSGAHE